MQLTQRIQQLSSESAFRVLARARALEAQGRDVVHLEIGDPEQRLFSLPADGLGELLVTKGVITRHQLFNALNESYRTGKPLAEVLIDLGVTDQETLTELLR